MTKLCAASTAPAAPDSFASENETATGSIDSEAREEIVKP